jgi:hypothetical protein
MPGLGCRPPVQAPEINGPEVTAEMEQAGRP